MQSAYVFQPNHPIQPTSILQTPIPSPLTERNSEIGRNRRVFISQAVTIIQQARPGFTPMAGARKAQMHMLCDKVQTASVPRCTGFFTRFDVPKTERACDLAKLALDYYNQRKKKNFTLENVCKLNKQTMYYCMILRASDAEADECRLFRCVVRSPRHSIMLCEIMDGDTISGDGDYLAAAIASQSKDAHTRNRARRGRI